MDLFLFIGLSFTISKDFGNCTIDYLENDATGDVHINDGGHLQMSNPFLDITKEGNRFTYNGMVRLVLTYYYCNYHLTAVF